jgi:polar amino acid transport system substrate-binding protein
MARFRLVFVAVLVCLVWTGTALCGPVFNRVTKGRVIRIGAPYNLYPQGFLNESNEWVGFELDIAAELARHMNLKPELIKINDKTWGPLLNQGKIDVAMSRIIHTRHLENEYDFSVPYFFDSPNLMIIKDTLKAAAEVKGRPIAAVRGSSSEKNAMRLLRELGDEHAEKNVVSFSDLASCFMALGKEKVSAWLDSGVILLEYVSRSPGRYQLIPAGDELFEICMVLPQDDSAWRDAINFAIQDMASDGSYKRIYDKWVGPDRGYYFPLRRAIEKWSE